MDPDDWEKSDSQKVDLKDLAKKITRGYNQQLPKSPYHSIGLPDGQRCVVQGWC